MVVTLAVAIVAAFLRLMPWTRVVQQLGLPVLILAQLGLFLLQHALGGTVEHPVSWLLGLHGLNGVLMLLLSLRLALLASRRPVSARVPDVAEVVAP
jgi:hypothetical protein